MRLKWLGHASFLLRTGGKIIYIDPYAGEYTEEANVVLITHAHGDHCDPEKLSKIRTPETVIYTSEACAEGIPPGNVKTMAPGDRVDINGVTVQAVEAYNLRRFKSPGVPYHPEGTQVAFIVEAEGKRIYHAGDTDHLPSMNELGDVTFALLPIMGRAVMDVDEAVEAAIAIVPEAVAPMHWRTSDPREFREKVEARNGPRVILMEEGEELTL